MERCFVGIDGGGTKTEFLCIDADGAVRGRMFAGTTYHVQIGVAGVERALREGMTALLAQAGRTLDDVAFAFIGLPAYGEDSAVDPQLDVLCQRVLGHDRYRCDNDMMCGWAGSLGGEDGINVVAGTGSIGFGRRGDVEARVGGWSELFSDEGSAYWIAIQGLNAFTRMSDGRLARGPLYETVRSALQIEADLDLCARTMSAGGIGRDGIAGLAPLVSQAAEAGDATAVDILDRAAAELAAIAVTLRRRLGYPPGERVPVSWSGSVLSKVAITRRAFTALLTAQGGFEIVEPRHSPAMGAALLARRLARYG